MSLLVAFFAGVFLGGIGFVFGWWIVGKLIPTADDLKEGRFANEYAFYIRLGVAASLFTYFFITGCKYGFFIAITYF